jgi:hypothetical protein
MVNTLAIYGHNYDCGQPPLTLSNALVGVSVVGVCLSRSNATWQDSSMLAADFDGTCCLLALDGQYVGYLWSQYDCGQPPLTLHEQCSRGCECGGWLPVV